jgi:hypothetical protein
VPPESKEKHAKLLMAGTRADNGKGAAVVIEDMHDLMPLVVSSSSTVCTANVVISLYILQCAAISPFKGIAALSVS